MAYAHIGHDSVIGNHCILVNNTALAGHVHVDDWAILSGFTLVHQYCHIGAHSFSGMGTAIGKDVPAFVTVFGNPAEARSMNFEGMRRRGFSEDAIHALRRAYKGLSPGADREEALAELANLLRSSRKSRCSVTRSSPRLAASPADHGQSAYCAGGGRSFRRYSGRRPDARPQGQHPESSSSVSAVR
jgi:acyl-ACP--UDP-N-acetylglucosamine O-acyltransferase